ncbi:hypothetical protein HK102_006059 [Quaeritorhiza haematococci]|nr:hypothetical protein HK102_006059 [Quaeritorhiza haematococci]
MNSQRSRTFFLSAVAIALLAQIPTTNALCSQIVQFDECSRTANLKLQECNNLVIDVPNLESAICQCERYAPLVQCYYLCPDDVTMMQQLLTLKTRESAACKAVDDLKAQGFTTLPPTPTPTASSPQVPGASPTTDGRKYTGTPIVGNPVDEVGSGNSTINNGNDKFLKDILNPNAAVSRHVGSLVGGVVGVLAGMCLLALA